MKRVDYGEDLVENQDMLVEELFTDGAPIATAAREKGHRVGTRSLCTGWDFRRADHRGRYLRELEVDRPFCVVLAFPDSAWSSLMNFADPASVREKRKVALPLVQFAVNVATIQMKHGRHFIIENPDRSAAWKQVPELIALAGTGGCWTARFHQCSLRRNS